MDRVILSTVKFPDVPAADPTGRRAGTSAPREVSA